jgi:hypothetical protein
MGLQTTDFLAGRRNSYFHSFLTSNCRPSNGIPVFFRPNAGGATPERS